MHTALKRLYDGMEGSHLKRLKTLRKVQARFWRPGLASAVKDYRAACLTFQGGKTFCARFCAPLIAGSRRAALTVFVCH